MIKYNGGVAYVVVNMAGKLMVANSSFAGNSFCQVIIFAGENFICADIHTNIQTYKQTYKFQTRLCSENKPLGTTSCRLAATRLTSNYTQELPQ